MINLVQFYSIPINLCSEAAKHKLLPLLQVDDFQHDAIYAYLKLYLSFDTSITQHLRSFESAWQAENDADFTAILLN